jgi:hypothetical protein
MDQERDQEPDQQRDHERNRERDREHAVMVCGTCGRTPEDKAVARLTWALGMEGGRQVWTCDECSRLHLRSIEGKLDSQWW